MYSKTKEIGKRKLTHDEHVAFHSEAKIFIEKCSAAKIFAAKIVEDYVAELEKEIVVVNRMNKSELTSQLEAKDAERDDAIFTFFAMVDLAKRSRVQLKKEAYDALSFILEGYDGIERLAYSAESSKVSAMVADLKSAKFASHIAELNLNRTLSDIEELNNEFIALDAQRTADIPEKKETDDIRARVDSLYAQIMDKLNAVVILMPNDGSSLTLEQTPEAVTLVSDLNNLIDKTNATYNRRTAKRGEN